MWLTQLIALLVQFAKAAGATVIATTSSPQKAEKLKKLGADHVIDYKTDPNWGETARKLTPEGAGVDHVIEVGGSGTLQQSIKSIKFEGIISIIGFLGGVDPKTQPTVLETLTNICTVRGVYVGSKALMRDMIRAIEANDIHPVVDDKVFTLEQTRDAYDYMVSILFPFDFCYLLTQCKVGSKALWKVDHQDQLSPSEQKHFPQGTGTGRVRIIYRGNSYVINSGIFYNRETLCLVVENIYNFGHSIQWMRGG